jgi:hypothetical protein
MSALTGLLRVADIIRVQSVTFCHYEDHMEISLFLSIPINNIHEDDLDQLGDGYVDEETNTWYYQTDSDLTDTHHTSWHIIKVRNSDIKAIAPYIREMLDQKILDHCSDNDAINIQNTGDVNALERNHQ